MNVFRPALPIALALLAWACIGRALLAHAPARVAVDLAQPLPVVTNWGTYGALLLLAFATAACAGFVAYRRLLHRLWQSDANHGLAAVVLSCAAALVAAWLAPVLYSSDVYAYAAYGEMARVGIDPYVPTHLALTAGTTIFTTAVWQWSNPLPACVYGPAFVAIARGAVTALQPLGIVAQLDGLRLIASLALAGCAIAAYHAYPGDARRKLVAAATIGLNPAALWCAAEGHNDAMALLAVIGGFALVRTRGFVAAGAAIVGLSATLKLPGAIPALVLAMRDRRARVVVLAGIGLSLLVSLPMMAGAAAHAQPRGPYAPQASLQAAVKASAWLVFHSDAAASIAAWIVAAAVAAALAARGVAQLRRQRNEGWTWLAAAAWALVPNPYPWYGIWIVAVAAVAPDTRGALVLLAFSATSLLRYEPDAVGTPGALTTGALAIAASLPFVGAVTTRAWRIHRRSDLVHTKRQ